MIVLDYCKSAKVREQYIAKFVNTHSKYYQDKIKLLSDFSDGKCYVGYLWDCLKNPVVVPKAVIENKLKFKKNIYIMWDILSEENIYIKNYWKYPKDRILYIETWTEDMYKELPEDIYMFDDSFSWSAIYTHEIDLENEPYCLYIE